MSDFTYLFEKEQINSTEKVEGKIHIEKTEKATAILLDRYKELEGIFPQSINKNETIHLISSDNFGSIEL